MSSHLWNTYYLYYEDHLPADSSTCHQCSEMLIVYHSSISFLFKIQTFKTNQKSGYVKFGDLLVLGEEQSTINYESKIMMYMKNPQ